MVQAIPFDKPHGQGYNGLRKWHNTCRIAESICEFIADGKKPVNVRVTPYSLVPNRTRSARSPVRRPGRCCEQKKGT
jgi:hypothetical protein